MHSPEFDFEKVHSNVEAAVKRLDVTWPVALDDDMTIWNAFENQYWPADYVADRTGHLRYSHFGEGDYDNTENVLRTLLGVRRLGARANQSVKAETASGETVNPETYLDVQHGQIDAQLGLHVYPAAGKLAAAERRARGRVDRREREDHRRPRPARRSCSACTPSR